MAETIILDPTAILSTRTQLDITSWVSAEGVDWGDAAIQAYLADQAVGSSPVDYRIPNRTIRLPLRLVTRGATSFATIRSNLQAKVGLMQREGGALMRQIGATPMYADVVNATLHLGGTLLQSVRNLDADAWLELECVPDWYGDEVTLSDHVETTNPYLIFTEATVNGNYPGRVRLIIDNDQATDQHGLLWGFRCRNYDSSTGGALFFQGESMTLVNGATSSALSGASGGNAAAIASLPAGSWISMLSTTLSSGPTPLTHIGTYRVWARVYSTDANAQFRLQWGQGSLSTHVTNDPAKVATASAFYLLDLGVITLGAIPAGTVQWFGVIQTQLAATGVTTYVDYVLLQPLDEGGGQVTYAPTVPSSVIQSPTLSAGTQADDAATGTVAWTSAAYAAQPDGQYATVALGAGVVSHWLKLTNFSFAIPASATITGIQLNIYWNNNSSTAGSGILGTHRLVKAGTVQGGAWTTYRDGGTWGASNIAVAGGPSDMWGTTWTPTDVNNVGFGGATSGTNTGSAGTFTYNIEWMNLTVYYTMAGGFTVAQDAVIYASNMAELRTDGMYRRGSGSTIFGPQAKVAGPLPRIPPSGLEGRAIQVFLKESRGNFAEEPDAGIDDISCQIKYRPSYLYTI